MAFDRFVICFYRWVFEVDWCIYCVDRWVLFVLGGVLLRVVGYFFALFVFVILLSVLLVIGDLVNLIFALLRFIVILFVVVVLGL